MSSQYKFLCDRVTGTWVREKQLKFLSYFDFSTCDTVLTVHSQRKVGTRDRGGTIFY